MTEERFLFLFFMNRSKFVFVNLAVLEFFFLFVTSLNLRATVVFIYLKQLASDKNKLHVEWVVDLCIGKNKNFIMKIAMVMFIVQLVLE